MNKKRIILFSIFGIALALRFILCLINREANDPHFEVVQWIMNKSMLPANEDCWECFQPKLYYLLNAAVCLVFNLRSRMDIIQGMQMLNFIFSFFTLLFLWKFIQRQNSTEKIKLWVFALIAFNPCLAAINVQATNDTLEILLGVLVVYFAEIYFDIRERSVLFILLIMLIGAAIVKGSGIVLFISIIAILMLKAIFGKREERRWLLQSFMILTAGYLLIVPVAGGYYHSYLKYQTPFKTNIEKLPPPSFSQRTIVARPGVTSVKDAFFTFRLFDMIRQPYIENEPEPYVLHRTSLWSELYGRTMFLHFDQCPWGWRTTVPAIIWAGRLLLCLGVVVLILFMSGLLYCMKLFIQNIYKRNSYISHTNEWIHLVFIALFLAFVIKYAYDFRDFSVMKSIFLFPALPSFIKMVMKGWELIKSPLLFKSISVLIACIISLSIYDICYLIGQLH